MLRLPPPKALIALEAVVRAGSVTAAAEELCVTHSAVSKQIGQLEEWIGKPLFEPNRRQMIPTSAAQRLSEAAGMAWALIAAAVDEVSRNQQESVLRVLAPATFAMRWLLPRLPETHRELPSTRIRVRQTHTPESWQDIPFDVVVRRGGRCPAQFQATTLFTEDLALVATPGVVEKLDLREAAVLSNLPLLEAETRPGELASWLRAAGVAPARRAMTFPHFYIALEAALAGHGALVAPTLVVEDLLYRGDLCDVSPVHHVPGPTYWVALDSNGPNVAEGRAFVSWLERAARSASTLERYSEQISV
ncbi:LysR family transcriptional regulator [Sinorhizobium meliloti]|uniref:LysR family transcriptional regulator n=1 Tax=Rhizobium meliloti TaxID=382 RepID=UPI000FE124A3|nr:LysR substrate-binding domain-containing protein [Sinorhizobium meliloti]RVK85008.1 LysR family transcriptional regulator [Sinorhizobium meliloti]